MNRNSELLAGTLRLIFPFVIVFGFYIILNGHLTPGGGFQGGAILAAVFVCKYLIFPMQMVKIDALQKIKKFLYILILLVPIVFLFAMLNAKWPFLNEPYLILLNVLIGLKVGCGMSVLFFRFVFYEGG